MNKPQNNNEDVVESYIVNTNIIRKFAGIIGADVLATNYKPNLRLFMAYLGASLGGIALLYTLIKLFENGYVEVLQVITNVTIPLQVPL